MHLNDLLFSLQQSSSKGHDLEDAGGKTSGGDVNTASVPPTPPKWHFHQDLENGIKTAQNGEFSAPQRAPLTSNHTQDHLQMSAWPQNATANGSFHNLTPKSSDVFNPLSAQTQSPSSPLQPGGSDPFKDGGFSLFYAAKEENLFQHNREKNLFDASPRSSADPFTSNKQDDLSQAPQPRVTNPFYTATPRAADLFQPDPMKSTELFHKADTKPDCPAEDDLFGTPSPKDFDVFSPSVDPFPSLVTRDLFQDLSSLEDPFAPAAKYDPFKEVSNGTADIFQPFPSETNSRGIFQTTPSDTASVAAVSPHSLSSPGEMKVHLLQSSPDLRTASHPADVILTTPQGTKHNILLPTPFTRARNLSISPGQSSPEITHVCSQYCFLSTPFSIVSVVFLFWTNRSKTVKECTLCSLFKLHSQVSTFKRPPKPLPRTRPPRRVKPPVPEKPPTPANPVG